MAHTGQKTWVMEWVCMNDFLVKKIMVGRDKLGIWDLHVYTNIYIKQVNNKDPLYSTGNYNLFYNNL